MKKEYFKFYGYMLDIVVFMIVMEEKELYKLFKMSLKLMFI